MANGGVGMHSPQSLANGSFWLMIFVIASAAAAP